MTKEQAIKILTEVTAVLKLSRQEHEVILQALKVVSELNSKETLENGRHIGSNI